MSDNEKMLAQQESTALSNQVNAPVGFDEDSSNDLIIPRVKVINALSPERTDGIAQEGDILNSLTQESLVGKCFIPIRQYYSNIHWNPDRDGDPRIFCRSFDGRVGQSELGSVSCAQCMKNEFDNSKVGRDAQPQCTKYLNFLGFIEGSPMPIVLSFARTNYNEGRKLLSMAKSMRQAIWAYAYKLESKLISKDRNKWYILVPTMERQTTEEERKLAAELFSVYNTADINADLERAGGGEKTTATDAATEAEL